ncbi:hypothetical protein V5799_026220 [Amblyomma americanum]|uniref:Uncharacterized protein n=1 Tax=Amblyomma americanum TaxID=6943 RepID=A0AAQ4DJ71_AMBAM
MGDHLSTKSIELPPDGVCTIIFYDSLYKRGGSTLNAPFEHNFQRFLNATDAHNITQFGIGFDYGNEALLKACGVISALNVNRAYASCAATVGTYPLFSLFRTLRITAQRLWHEVFQTIGDAQLPTTLALSVGIPMRRYKPRNPDQCAQGDSDPSKNLIMAPCKTFQGPQLADALELCEVKTNYTSLKYIIAAMDIDYSDPRFYILLWLQSLIRFFQNVYTVPDMTMFCHALDTYPPCLRYNR